MDQIEKHASIILGFKEAESITKQYAKTFYFASHFLTKAKKQACFSVYAVCRMTDESVDNAKQEAKRAGLMNIQKKIDSAYQHIKLSDNLLLAFQDTIDKYSIPKGYFNQLIEGMYMDLDKNRYRDFKELNSYCYKAAGVIGLIMLKILGSNKDEAEKYALDLGTAMQLTNILRDINEDAVRGRIYLPQDEIQSFSVREADILFSRSSDNFIALLKFQIQRARQYYKNSGLGIKYIPGVRSRLVVSLMRNMYSGILNIIEKNRFNVFAQRACVGQGAKLGILLKTILGGKYL